MKMLELQIPPLPKFITVGHSWWKQGKSHFRRSWDIYDLILVTNGTLYITEDDRSYELLPDSMLLLEPGRTHWGHRPCEEDTETYFLHFSHPPALREMESDGFTWHDEFQKISDYDPSLRQHLMYVPKYTQHGLTKLIPLLEKIIEINHRVFKQNALELHCLTSQLFLELQNIIHRQQPMSRSLELCTGIARYLESRIQEPFNSKQLEAVFHFHFDYLSRCMKKHTDMTPLQYLHYIRIERAKRMLTDTMSSIQQIAYELGFEHSNYFIRMFRSKEGVTPGKYRELMHNHQLQAASPMDQQRT